MTSSECANCVSNIADGNNSFSIIIPGSWKIPSYLEDNIIEKLKNLLKIKSETNIELHVQESRERGNKANSEENFSSDFDTLKTAKLQILKNVKYNDLKDMVIEGN